MSEIKLSENKNLKNHKNAVLIFFLYSLKCIIFVYGPKMWILPRIQNHFMFPIISNHILLKNSYF
jgi:hypothetical protein